MFIKRINSKPEIMKNKMSIEDNIILAKRMLVDNVYRSARLEGIGVTFAETEDIINNKNCSNIKPDDVNDILNLKRAWQFLLDPENLKRDIDLAFMQDLHSIIGKGMPTLKWNEIGVFRKDGVTIGGTNWRPRIPDSERIFNELKELKQKEDITERAFDILLWSCRTQAFKDGNKRIATLMCNFELIKNGCGIFSVPDDKFSKFKELLVKFYETNESTQIKEFIYNHCYIYDSDGLAFNEKFE